MSKVVMYTAKYCPYCIRAKHLLQHKDVQLEEIPIDTDQTQKRVMMQRTQRRTVPQIFIGDLHVGGFDDLASLEARGKLDPLLSQ